MQIIENYRRAQLNKRHTPPSQTPIAQMSVVPQASDRLSLVPANNFAPRFGSANHTTTSYTSLLNSQFVISFAGLMTLGLVAWRWISGRSQNNNSRPGPSTNPKRPSTPPHNFGSFQSNPASNGPSTEQKQSPLPPNGFPSFGLLDVEAFPPSLTAQKPPSPISTTSSPIKRPEEGTLYFRTLSNNTFSSQLSEMASDLESQLPPPSQYSSIVDMQQWVEVQSHPSANPTPSLSPRPRQSPQSDVFTITPPPRATVQAPDTTEDTCSEISTANKDKAAE